MSYLDESASKEAELEKARSRSVVSMVLGIIGVTILLFGVPSIIAAVKGYKAKETHRRYPAEASAYGASMANAGIVLAWIGIAFTAIFVLVIVLGIAFGIELEEAGFVLLRP